MRRFERDKTSRLVIVIHRMMNDGEEIRLNSSEIPSVAL